MVANNEFNSLFEEKISLDDNGLPRKVNFPQASKTFTDFSQGGLNNTNRSLDFAIEGEGFFEVTDNRGKQLFTRNGSFHISKEGELVTSEGFKVNGSVNIPKDGNIQTLTVTEGGELEMLSVDGKSYRKIGSIRIAKIENPQELNRLSSNYYYNNDPKKTYEDMNKNDFTLVNKFLEGANSNPITSMVSMISSMREFEAAQKVISMQSEIFNSEMRKLT
jgi:flagellar basal-body rod protein FlgG